MSMKLKIIPVFFICIIFSFSAKQDYLAPSTKFTLDTWKLQIPGPLEIKDLKNYASSHFYLTKEGFMHFHLDAAEKGTTPNTTTVRDELRNLQHWKITENHELSAIIRIKCTITDFKVTIAQIKCTTENDESAPPFLRLAFDGKNLYAYLKENVNSDKATKILLKPDVGDMFVAVNIKVKDKRLIITVDDAEVLSKDVSYWPLNNHFKLGCYPQQTTGIFDVDVKKMVVN